jgi:hypothetical protein
LREVAPDGSIEIAFANQHRLDAHAGHEGDLVEHAPVLRFAGGNEKLPAPLARSKGDREDSMRADVLLRQEAHDLLRHEPLTDVDVLDAMLPCQLGQQHLLGHQLQRQESITETTALLLLVSERSDEMLRIEVACLHQQLADLDRRCHRRSELPAGAGT